MAIFAARYFAVRAMSARAGVQDVKGGGHRRRVPQGGEFLEASTKATLRKRDGPQSKVSACVSHARHEPERCVRRPFWLEELTDGRILGEGVAAVTGVFEHYTAARSYNCSR